MSEPDVVEDEGHHGSSTRTIDLVMEEVEHAQQEAETKKQDKRETADVDKGDKEAKRTMASAAAEAQGEKEKKLLIGSTDSQVGVSVQVGEVVESSSSADADTKKSKDETTTATRDKTSEGDNDGSSSDAALAVSALPGAYPQRGMNASFIEQQQQQQPQLQQLQEHADMEAADMEAAVDDDNNNENSEDILIMATLVDDTQQSQQQLTPGPPALAPSVTMATQIRGIDSTGRIIDFDQEGEGTDEENNAKDGALTGVKDELNPSASFLAGTNKNPWRTNPRYRTLLGAAVALFLMLVILVPLAIVKPWEGSGSGDKSPQNDKNNPQVQARLGNSASPSLAPSCSPSWTPSSVPSQSSAPSPMPSLIPTTSSEPSTAPSIDDWFVANIGANNESHVAFAAVHYKFQSDDCTSDQATNVLLEIGCQAGIDGDPQLLVVLPNQSSNDTTAAVNTNGNVTCTRQGPDVFLCEAEVRHDDFVVLVVCASSRDQQFHVQAKASTRLEPECGRFDQMPPFIGGSVVYSASAKHTVTLGEYCFGDSPAVGTNVALMDDNTFCDDPIHATSFNGKPICTDEEECQEPWNCPISGEPCEGNPHCDIILHEVGATYPVVQDCAVLTADEYWEREPTLDHDFLLRRAAGQFSFNFGLPLPSSLTLLPP